jgi:hypothetical protein
MNQLDRIERKLDLLLSEKRKKKLVKATVITELTGWDANRMRKARRNNDLHWEKKDGSIVYDLNSLDKKFLKQSA